MPLIDFIARCQNNIQKMTGKDVSRTFVIMYRRTLSNSKVQYRQKWIIVPQAMRNQPPWRLVANVRCKHPKYKKVISQISNCNMLS